MRWTSFTLAAVLALLVAQSAAAQSGADLEKAKGCPTCHLPDGKKIGPSYAEIAAKYRGDPAAADKIVTLLKEGKRHPRATASDAELRAIAGYVIGGR